MPASRAGRNVARPMTTLSQRVRDGVVPMSLWNAVCGESVTPAFGQPGQVVGVDGERIRLAQGSSYPTVEADGDDVDEGSHGWTSWSRPAWTATTVQQTSRPVDGVFVGPVTR